jgi:hypothetical protein
MARWNNLRQLNCDTVILKQSASPRASNLHMTHTQGISSDGAWQVLDLPDAQIQSEDRLSSKQQARPLMIQQVSFRNSAMHDGVRESG